MLCPSQTSGFNVPNYVRRRHVQPIQINWSRNGPSRSSRDAVDDIWIPLITARVQTVAQVHGAPPDFSNNVRRYLNDTIPGRWIGRGGGEDQLHRKWPTRSSDLTPCDFYLWGYVKDRVFIPPMPDIGLNTAINCANTAVHDKKQRQCGRDWNVYQDCSKFKLSSFKERWNLSANSNEFRNPHTDVRGSVEVMTQQGEDKCNVIMQRKRIPSLHTTAVSLVHSRRNADNNGTRITGARKKASGDKKRNQESGSDREESSEKIKGASARTWDFGSFPIQRPQLVSQTGVASICHRLDSCILFPTSFSGTYDTVNYISQFRL
ncbi:hypothetical protein ANN_24115 [Periplaneta americana]|uniref:Uncharacterized protein n=1 Tax=Periplaneta americana TaxID=6978 RepID=A0ABQ8S2G5_PERAM|nr:hypothetical protein ANN_24115 [Periplaneta americana]